MAIIRGARRTKRAVFLGFSAVFGFFLLLVMPSLRAPGGSGGGLGNVANADVPYSEGGYPSPSPDPDPGCP
ncbi:MAG: hypothetical protein Q7S95_03670 [bacterium]|nr:hypothetical protein [bacterium]